MATSFNFFFGGGEGVRMVFSKRLLKLRYGENKTWKLLKYETLENHFSVFQ